VIDNLYAVGRRGNSNHKGKLDKSSLSMAQETKQEVIQLTMCSI